MGAVRMTDESAEMLWVGGAVLGIAAAWAALVLRAEPGAAVDGLEDHQINGYEALSAIEQGLYADLEIAGLEIDAFHDGHEGTWPGVDQLAAEFIPPFAADGAWERRGRPAWSLTSTDSDAVHAAAYLGMSSDRGVAGSFLLFLEHRHGDGDPAANALVEAEEHFQIWYHDGDEVRAPAQLAEPGLIRGGWRQIVPYRGAQELQRLDRGATAS